jgi:hypothetical protein
VSERTADHSPQRWQELAAPAREALQGKLSGLFGAANDETAFDRCAFDKQQTLLLIAARLEEKGLWHVIRRITNVYGQSGVGIGFAAWPMIESTLRRRRDFTWWFANHRNTSGGFYEKGRGEAVLHFLYVEGEPRKWYVHFDLYSPVHSLRSAINHLRHEFFGKLTPDWRLIQEHLQL